MRLICLADTHNQHHDIAIPEGDILIHAGDCTDGGTKNETSDFLEWLTNQPHEHKILVPGNHDFYFQKPENLKNLPKDIHLLIDRGVEIEGLHFWGSPFTPGIGTWAFNRERGADIKKHWDLIPKTTDILITHTPPHGILDQIGSGLNLGCEELSQTLEVVQPKYHLFGHIHHSSGSLKRSKSQYFNLSILDERFRIMNSPVVLDL
ncbi:metallophosphatase domain-containing protein [Gramella jeungdoensis]|uniref:Metallophosphatase domain-containing protein n=1 Tax=Gramella jeungdoensis TaxID=708091 RepID=A0ABT0Z044_9FLAO|nr:metallophosphatase domain-containing protein [Gramella jeungdoensis]MCM8568768.1 metallophosphatase domain-containing protein [Gramella jeungdoensis]